MEQELPLELARVETLIDTSSHPWITTLVAVGVVIVLMWMLHGALHFALVKLLRPMPLMHALATGVRAPMRWTFIAAGLAALFSASPTTCRRSARYAIWPCWR